MAIFEDDPEIKSANFQQGESPFNAGPVPVNSSCMNAGGWAFEGSGSGTLTIDFTDGTSYEYYNVSPLVFANLLRSNSKGGFFNRRIRNAGYGFSRVG